MPGIMEDGFKTTVAFAVDTTIPELEIIDVTPPGVDQGGAINRTTMANTAFRTKAAKKLKEMTDATLTVAYDPALLTVLLTISGVNTLITYTFPDSSTWAIYGFIDKAEPGTISEGDMPTMEITVVHSMRHSTTNAETAPVYDDGTP